MFNSSSGNSKAHPQPVPLAKLKDSFNDGTSITYLEELEKRYLNDPQSVDKTWASFFNSLGTTVAGVSCSSSSGPLLTTCPRRSPWCARGGHCGGV
jgi:2-oxoglutarate dehydrogenase E1 component